MRSHEITKFSSMTKFTGSRSVINVAFVIFSCSFGRSSFGDVTEVETAYSNTSLSIVANNAKAGNAEARYWFLKAANQGVAAAQHSLGLMYGKGEGVPRMMSRPGVGF